MRAIRIQDLASGIYVHSKLVFIFLITAIQSFGGVFQQLLFGGGQAIHTFAANFIQQFIEHFLISGRLRFIGIIGFAGLF